MANQNPFSQLFKPLVDPFANIFKKKGSTNQTSTPSTLFTPANTAPKIAVPSINQTSAQIQTPAQIQQPAKIQTQAQTQTPIPSINQTSAQIQTPAPIQTPANNIHTVKSGDNLSKIAAQAGMSLQNLLALNPQFQENPDLIQPGQTVNLSSGATGATSAGFTPQAIPEVQTTPTDTSVDTVTGADDDTTTIDDQVDDVVTSDTLTDPDTQKTLEAANDAYQESLKLSPDELSTQEDLDTLIESTKKAFRGTSGQAIPLEFITGQLASIERRATGLAEPLQRKLARLQASRLASIESSKFALERADKKAEQQLSATQTATEAAEEDADEARAEAESLRRFNITNQLARDKFEENKRRFGIAEANRLAEIEASDLETTDAVDDSVVVNQAKIDASNDTIDLIDDLIVSPGLDSSVGPNALARLSSVFGIKNLTFDRLTGQSQEFIAGVEQIVSQFSLDALIKAKAEGATFGALSDSELRILASSATKIGTWKIVNRKGETVGYNVSEKAFKKELAKIKEITNRAIEKFGGGVNTAETREIDGQTYRKVDGGWELIQ